MRSSSVFISLNLMVCYSCQTLSHVVTHAAPPATLRVAGCRFTTYRHRFARAAPAPRAKRNEKNRGRASPVKWRAPRRAAASRQQGLTTLGKSDVVRHSIRGAANRFKNRGRVRAAYKVRPSGCRLITY